MSLSHAILGFLNYRPMSGYALKKNFDESIIHFWSATQSHIYKELEDLEKKGFVSSEAIEQEKRPDRKEYRPTDTGRAELSRWLSTPLPSTQIREGWLIQLFFGQELTKEELVALLEERRREASNKIAELEQVGESIRERRQRLPKDMQAHADMWKLTLDYGLAYYSFELKWLDKVIRRWQQS